MAQFTLYFSLGFDHIFALQGYDHVLFILTLCCTCSEAEWKKIVAMITAFTIGHSITLALTAAGVFLPNNHVVEILIALTILLTSILNLISLKFSYWEKDKVTFLLAMIFGLIHGMGFSLFFNVLGSDADHLISTLLAFNLGIEFAQLLVVSIFFGVYIAMKKWAHVKQIYWTAVISSSAFVVSLFLILTRI